MPEELMRERAAAEGEARLDLGDTDLPEVLAPEESLVPPVPPEGLDTILYEHDERDSRADLRRQIATMELALARLFGSAFPRRGIDFSVPGMGGPRLLSVDELEKVRDGLAARIQEVRADLHDYAVVEEANRELIEEMVADPASHKWERVYNEDIGEPGCKHWHATPRWGVLGMLLGWWRVKISSGCPLAEGLRPPDGNQAAAAEEAEAPLDRRRAAPDRPGASAAAGRGGARGRAASGALGRLPALGDRDLRRHPAADRRVRRRPAPGPRDDRRGAGTGLAGWARARRPRALCGLPLPQPAAGGCGGRPDLRGSAARD